LAQLQVRPVPDRRESDKLKDEVAKPKDCEGDPNPVVTPKAVKAVDKRSPNWRKEHYQRVTTAQPEPGVNAGQSLRHLDGNR
jgi:hypothetical protein